MLFRRRERVGQTKATTINYLKNLKLLFKCAKDEYCYTDESFPRGFDGMPSKDLLSKIKITETQLLHIYRRSTKLCPQELFSRKVDEAKTMPSYLEMNDVLEKYFQQIPDEVDALEAAFGSDGKVTVKSDRQSTTVQKDVNNWSSP